MNLDALREINTNNPEILEQSAIENSSDPETVKGIALFVVDNGYEALTAKQKYHFDNAIRVLIEDVQCDGYTHECEEWPNNCTNILDDDDLVDYYENNGGYCESCKAQASVDAHSKEVCFRD